MKGFLGKHKTDVLVGLLVFVFVAPLAGGGGANQLPRVALAAALVDHGSVEITDYEGELDVDYAIREDRLYSDKAPGSSFVFAPVYAIYKLVSGSDMLSSPRIVRFVHKLVVASAPAAVLASLVAGSLGSMPARGRAWIALMLAGGTMLAPFATVGFGHVLAALLAFTGFLLTRSSAAPWWTAFAAGFVVALGVTVEYTVAIVAVALGLFLWLTAGRRVIPFVLGGLPLAVALLAYHHVAFGHPLHTSYRYANSLTGEFSGVGLAWPDPGDLFSVFLGERGLFVLTPIVVVAILGFLPFGHGRPSVPRRELWLVLGILAAFAVVPAMWIDQAAGPYGGHSPGPRFVVPALPFLAVPLAGMLPRWPRTTSVAGGVSISLMMLATLTHPLASHDQGIPAIAQWWDLAVTGSVRINVLVELLGPIGWLIHLGAVAFLAWWLIRQVRGRVPASVA